MLYFFKNKIKKNSWRYYCFTPVYQKSWWYDLQFLRYRVWQTEIGNDGSFFALLPHPHKNPTKNEIWKNEKKLLEISSFYTNVPKTTTQKIKISKNWKSILRYHFTNVYQKSHSYNVCFSRYEVRQTEFVLIFNHFQPFI